MIPRVLAHATGKMQLFGKRALGGGDDGDWGFSFGLVDFEMTYTFVWNTG